MAAVLAALVYARSQLKTSSEENKRVKSLVQIVLNNLREQVCHLFSSFIRT